MTDDALLHPPTPDPVWLAANSGDGWHGTAGIVPAPHPDVEHQHHYDRLRAEHARQMDEDYQAWRRERFAGDFETWRGEQRQPVAPEHEGWLRGLGRAIGETVTGTREPDLPSDRR
jgi:hypothetical protein